jgi:HEAT repeat protein
MRGEVSRAKGLRIARVVLATCCVWLVLGTRTAFPQAPQENAWQILQAGLNEHSTSNRAAAVRVLGLLQGDPRAIELAEKALSDKKPAVRAAAATALGQLGSRPSIPLLKEALADKNNRVFFAAADSLLTLGDPAGYDLYYEVLTGERKSGEGLIPEKKKLISDPRALTLMGFGVGIGFAPYAGYGWMMWQELTHDYMSPVRVNALKKLANDPDPRIGEGLVRAASDKHTTVRVAALSATASHGGSSLISAIEPHMKDKKAAVRYTAAAAFLRLSALLPVDDTATAQRK